MTTPTATESPCRTAVLVLGMHRSGTSALTWLLRHLDIAMPDDAIESHADNPKGYWEPQAVVKVDDRILRTARTSWFDPRPLALDRIPADIAAAHRADLRTAITASFGDAARIAIKDPRLCRMVPLIAEALAEAGYSTRAVLMLRPPAEIARSLRARDRSTPAYAHALWLSHMIAAERDTRGMPRTVLTYDGLLADWRSAMARLAGLVDRADWMPDAEASAAIVAFLDPALRRQKSGGTSGLEPAFERIVAEVDAALLALVARDDADARARMVVAARAWEADRHLLDDIIHDELRHRRHDELRLRAAHPEPEAEPEPVEQATSAAEPAPRPAEPPPRTDPPSPLAEQIALVRDSGLFDSDWYRHRYPDAGASGLDLVEHYLTIGASLGYDPSPLFQTGYYARQMARRLGRGA